MRILCALIYIGFGTWAYAELSSGLGKIRFPIGIGVFYALVFSSTLLFNKGLMRKLKRQSLPEFVAELGKKGRISRQQFSATRAMACEDLSTGCTAYFIDIGQNRTLLLYGQDYNFVQFDDDGEAIGPRDFPTAEFTLLRMIGNPEILEIEKAGALIELEDFGEPQPDVLWGLDIKLVDGLVFLEPSYDTIRSTLAAARNSLGQSALRS